MSANWPELPYAHWSVTCDTLHAHTQVLGKLAVVLAPPEPQLQHAALRLTARGWETAPLPAPDGSGAFNVALDLRAHEALVEHVDGREQRISLTPNRSVAAVTAPDWASSTASPQAESSSMATSSIRAAANSSDELVNPANRWICSSRTC